MKNNFLKKGLVVTLATALVVTPMLMSDATSLVSQASTSAVTTPSTTSSVTTSTYVPVVTNTVTTASGTTLVSTAAGLYKSSIATAVTTPLATANAALGVATGEKAFVTVYNSQCGPLAQACVDNAAAALGVTPGAALDLFAGKIGTDGKYTEVTKAATPLTFSFEKPANIPAGYDVAIIRVQEGGIITILPDTDNDPSTVTIATDGFGVFAFVSAPAGSFNAFR